MIHMLISFVIGLIIFLFGLQIMKLGFQNLAGDKLRTNLLKFTKTKIRGFLTGIVSTAFLQSSTAITVLTIGFVNAGIMSFIQSIGIILGTNIGTTITTQIMALKIEALAIPLLIVGAIIRVIPFRNFANLGLVIGGFGCIFLGMNIMKLISIPLKESGWIEWAVSSTDYPILVGVFIGMILTAITHSSSATIAITMGFYSADVIGLGFAIALVLGSNLGTCITGIIAAINANNAAKKVALSHVVLNLIGVIAFMPMIPIMIKYAPLLSKNPEIQIAHIQTIFNIVCSLAMLPFIEQFAKLISFCLPDRSYK